MSLKNWQSVVGLILISTILWFFNLNWQLPGVNWLRHQLYTIKTVEPVNETSAETAALEAAVFNLEQENARLRDLLGAPLSPGWQFLPVPVVGLEADTLTLGLGSLSGVKDGLTVMAYQKESINNGVILGRVFQVQSRQAKVRLLTSPGLSVKAKTSSGASGLVTGDGQTVWFDQVVQAQRLTNGDLILTAGGDGWLAGLVIGRVGEIVKAESAIYQKAKVTLVIDPALVVNAYLVSD